MVRLLIIGLLFPFILFAGFSLKKTKPLLKAEKTEVKKVEDPSEANKETFKLLEGEILGKIEKGQYIKNPEKKSNSE
jgi:hypothetical protein